LWESVWDMQWQVMPIELVCLDKGIPPSRFDEHQVLPFTIGATLGKGAYGTVLEITLDEDHDVIYEALRACKAGKVCASLEISRFGSVGYFRFRSHSLSAIKNPVEGLLFWRLGFPNNFSRFLGLVHSVLIKSQLETVLNPPLAAKKLEDPASETQVILDNKENRETRILTNLADFKHPHLIQLITAFYHGREYYMIFPKARSSLRDVFKKEQHVGDTEYLLWLLRQLYGLAGGLNKIHTGASNDMFLGVPTANGQKGLHGDIAAANLLIMDTLPDLKENESSFGRTQICDFGIGKMVDNKNIALSVVSVTNRGQPSYAPPESTCGKSDVPPQSRWRDIWCLGCVFFEICIWLLEGGIKLTEFSSERLVPLP
jgi:serine/threonine protein kinase